MPRDPGDAVERGQLVEQVVGQLGRLDVDEPAAEAGQVAVGDLRADGHAPGRRRAPHTRRIVDGSPAWKPQATFALVTTPSSASSSPSRQTPNPSPRSALRSIRRARPMWSPGQSGTGAAVPTGRRVDIDNFSTQSCSDHHVPCARLRVGVRTGGEAAPVPTTGIVAPAILRVPPRRRGRGRRRGPHRLRQPGRRTLLGHDPADLRGAAADRAGAGAVPGGARGRLRPLPRRPGTGELFGSTMQLPALHAHGAEVLVELTLSPLDGPTSSAGVVRRRAARRQRPPSGWSASWRWAATSPPPSA